MNKTITEFKFLNVEQLSELLHLKPSTIYKKVCAGTIPYIKLGGRVLFDAEVTMKWVSEHHVEPINVINN